MRVSYTAPYDLNLSGSVTELLGLRSDILALSDAAREAVLLTTDTDFDPTPCSRALSRLSITRSIGPLLVEVRNETLSISGSPDALRSLATNFTFFETYQYKGYHSHIEYYEGHPLIAPDAVPLVVSIG